SLGRGRRRASEAPPGRGRRPRAVRPKLRRELEPVSLRQALDVALVEQLDADVRVALAELAQLAVLARDERLLHDGDLDVQVLLRQVEVRLEGLDGATLLIGLEDE